MTIQPSLTRKEIGVMLKRSEHVVRKWIREAGITHRRSLLPLEVELIRKRVEEGKTATNNDDLKISSVDDGGALQ